MAVVLAFRLAILLAPSGYRVVKMEQQASGQPGPTALGRWLYDRIAAGDSDEDLALAITARTGMLAEVATYSDPFETRKLQVRWGRNSGAAGGADDAVTTHHFVALVAGSPTATWEEADFTAVEGPFTAFWDAIKDRWDDDVTLKQYRWYKAGPGIAPPQPPVRIVDVNSAGSVTGGAQCPPQVAISVTEKTTDPKSWGRFYLPHPNAGMACGLTGRIVAATQTDIADAADTMYQAFKSAGKPAVVYSTAKAARPTAGGGELPAIAARALTVDQIQVDDLFDVIRSRRWNEPLLRLQRDIT